jgi:hypothetical protein
VIVDDETRFEFPTMAFIIKPDGNHFTIWCNGCRIGQRVGKVVKECKPRSLRTAQHIVKHEAKRRLKMLLTAAKIEAKRYRDALKELELTNGRA